MEFKGTKGEWFLNSDRVVDKKGSTIISACFRTHSENKENAKLIASAPELLEALQEAKKELEFHNWKNTTTYLKVEKAIEKALK